MKLGWGRGGTTPIQIVQMVGSNCKLLSLMCAANEGVLGKDRFIWNFRKSVGVFAFEEFEVNKKFL